MALHRLAMESIFTPERSLDRSRYEQEQRTQIVEHKLTLLQIDWVGPDLHREESSYRPKPRFHERKAGRHHP